MRVAHPEYDARFVRKADASDSEQRHPARHGHNGCEIALTRKNALFAGHDEGAKNWAITASLLETCKLNGVDPLAWLTDVLTKLIKRWPASRIEELMPWSYVKKPA
jgi:IS66 C-terminal element